MKVFVWEQVDTVSSYYHEGGGLLIVAKDVARAKELIADHPHAYVSAEEWEQAIIIDAADGEQERLITFPDAGCCG